MLLLLLLLLLISLPLELLPLGCIVVMMLPLLQAPSPSWLLGLRFEVIVVELMRVVAQVSVAVVVEAIRRLLQGVGAIMFSLAAPKIYKQRQLGNKRLRRRQLLGGKDQRNSNLKS